jgi:hypothetical protein
MKSHLLPALCWGLTWLLLGQLSLHANVLFQDNFDRNWNGSETLATGAGRIERGRWFANPTALQIRVTDEKALSSPASIVLEVDDEKKGNTPPKPLWGLWGSPENQTLSIPGPLTFTFGFLVSRTDGSPGAEAVIAARPGTGQVRIRLGDGGKVLVTGPGKTDETLAKIKADTWYHLQIALPETTDTSNAESRITLYAATADRERGEALGSVTLTGFPADLLYQGFSLTNTQPGLRVYFDDFRAEQGSFE